MWDSLINKTAARGSWPTLAVGQEEMPPRVPRTRVYTYLDFYWKAANHPYNLLGQPWILFAKQNAFSINCLVHFLLIVWWFSSKQMSAPRYGWHIALSGERRRCSLVTPLLGMFNWCGRAQPLRFRPQYLKKGWGYFSRCHESSSSSSQSWGHWWFLISNKSGGLCCLRSPMSFIQEEH